MWKSFRKQARTEETQKSEHTYHVVRYECNEYEFMANEVETLDAHFGKKKLRKEAVWSL